MSFEQRIIELESVVAHLQYDLEQLNSVVLQQRKLIELQQAIQGKLEARLAELAEPAEQRDPELERPPHY